jgi:hypothetical protein
MFEALRLVWYDLGGTPILPLSAVASPIRFMILVGTECDTIQYKYVKESFMKKVIFVKYL